MRPSHALTELAPACLADGPSCTVEAACCLDRAAWPSVLAANMRPLSCATASKPDQGLQGRQPKCFYCKKEQYNEIIMREIEPRLSRFKTRF